MKTMPEVPAWATPVPEKHIDEVLREKPVYEGPGLSFERILENAVRFYEELGYEVVRAPVGEETWLPPVKMPRTLEGRVSLLKAHRGRRIPGTNPPSVCQGFVRKLYAEGMMLVPSEIA